MHSGKNSMKKPTFLVKIRKNNWFIHTLSHLTQWKWGRKGYLFISEFEFVFVFKICLLQHIRKYLVKQLIIIWYHKAHIHQARNRYIEKAQNNLDPPAEVWLQPCTLQRGWIQPQNGLLSYSRTWLSILQARTSQHVLYWLICHSTLFTSLKETSSLELSAFDILRF